MVKDRDSRGRPKKIERRPFHVSKLELAAIYEGLTLLGFWKAKEGSDADTPYSTRSLDDLRFEALKVWPELNSTYRGKNDAR